MAKKPQKVAAVAAAVKAKVVAQPATPITDLRDQVGEWVDTLPDDDWVFKGYKVEAIGVSDLSIYILADGQAPKEICLLDDGTVALLPGSLSPAFYVEDTLRESCINYTTDTGGLFEHIWILKEEPPVEDQLREALKQQNNHTNTEVSGLGAEKPAVGDTPVVQVEVIECVCKAKTLDGSPWFEVKSNVVRDVKFNDWRDYYYTPRKIVNQ